MTIAGQTFTVTQDNGCTFSINPSSQNFAAAGGSNSVGVTAGSGCNWTATSNAAWITITSGTPGSGNGTLNYTVAANSGPQRSGTMTITGQTFTVTQDNGCTFSINPSSQNFAAAGGSNSVGVTAGSGCNWTATSNAAWITITSGAPGSGNGAVNYSVTANSGPQRTGTMTIAGQTFTVTQDNGCTFSINPSSQNFAAAGGSGSTNVTAAAGCEWTAQSNATWITLTTFSGTGNGAVGFVVAANAGPQRTGTATIAGQTFTITQDAFVCPAITVNPVNLPNGFTSASYGQTITASDGVSPYSFTVTGGSLPSGLNLSSSGALTGTPSTTGTFNFTVLATDANTCTGTRSYTVVIGGSGLQFYPLPAPVRLLDTRGGVTGCVTNVGTLAAGSTRTQAARTACSTIPANATAIIGNITVVPSGPGFLTLFPSDATQPTVANSNFTAGEVTNNFFTVGLGTTGPDAGAFKIFTSATTHVIIDLAGYYAPPDVSGLYYHPLPSPVRLVQTFPGQTGCFANPTVTQLQGTNDPNANPALDLTVDGRGAGLPSPCNSIPSDAVVLVGNATTVFPSAPLGFGYLTIYPSDAARPTVASSNYGNNDIINGPFAVKLGADGKFKVYTFSTTHLVIDISGYYSTSANDANGAGLLFNPLPTPMRLLETRNIPGFPLTGCYKLGAPIPGGTGGIRTQQVWGTCSDQLITIQNGARAVVGNVTGINPVGAGFGTFFPGNVGTAPTVATTNYPFPVTFGYNRHYYVGLSPTDGTFKILTQFTSDYIVDVSGYFAP